MPAVSKSRTLSPVLLRPILVVDFSKIRNPLPVIVVPLGMVYGELPPDSSSSCQPDISTGDPSELYISIHSVSSELGPEGFGRNSFICTAA